jgi:O-antigen/teichoic acid export membrane protein
MGDGQIATPYVIVVLVAVLLALSTLDAVLGNAVLAALDELQLAVRATYVGAVIGIPLVALGAIHFGAAGALGGVIIGLAVRIVIELVGYSFHENSLRAQGVGSNAT